MFGQLIAECRHVLGRLIRSEAREKDPEKEERDKEERERHAEKFRANVAAKKEKHQQLRQSFHARKARVNLRRSAERDTLKTHVNINRPKPKAIPKPKASMK